MTNYAYKIAFSTENIVLAQRILDDLTGAFDETAEGEIGLKCEAVALIPGGTVTQADLDADAAFAEEMAKFMNAGFNRSPMPKGMPEV
ncbi:hypothetical protein ACI3ET_16370 [Ornithinimicrobium sp. LYQ121]|uniref:hypothetical protein n=1 Tax=Ornithinimicrobium sp. LYQ121 TaxID=3378801 RepID=UPI003854B9E8